MDTSAIQGNINQVEPKTDWAMRSYRVVFRSSSAVHVDAESFGKTETTVAFYRAGSVFAEYPRVLVREVSEIQGSFRRGSQQRA
jgi:hypothetical protein